MVTKIIYFFVVDFMEYFKTCFEQLVIFFKFFPPGLVVFSSFTLKIKLFRNLQ